MARFALLCFFFWIFLAVAQFESFSPHNGLVYSVHLPEKMGNASSGSIFFQINCTHQVEWCALGQGTQMKGANMVVVYTSSRNNVTVSSRAGVSHTEPLYNKDAKLAVMEGSGVHDGVITANVRCDDCVDWDSDNHDVANGSSSWIWAVKFGQPLNSASVSATITHHDYSGAYIVERHKASGNISQNPFLQLAPMSIHSGPSSFDYQAFDKKKISHAVLMTAAFVVLFPCSALALRVFPSSNVLAIHATLQLFTLAVAIAGFGVGISMAKDIHLFYSHHPIIGMVVVGCLVVFQPAMGLLQHRFFRKTGGKGPFAYLHRWFGRIMIVLGVINVGLGYRLTGIGDPDAPRGAVIAVGVVAGVVAVIYILIVGLAERRWRRQANADATE
ncbi:uncharacterized protein N7459_008891 [Penicillium hispanicum]|uniref:uncharacterized protein n=1 Tax=Penicillium hispanicum TaxID=1080232 RepID=UPI00254052B0|nr:uncharacterized protein N7459_008891 [Penicillium hispanicum]KAJ5569461.1 hypothetical protein N7459_008891 [Penicillium hispanicum]